MCEYSTPYPDPRLRKHDARLGGVAEEDRNDMEGAEKAPLDRRTDALPPLLVAEGTRGRPLAESRRDAVLQLRR